MTDKPQSRPPELGGPPPAVPPSVAGGKEGGKPPARSSRRRRRILALAIAAVVVAGALGVWQFWRHTTTDPPLPDLTGADVEVAEIIEEARQEVFRARSSAPAWGRLGKVLLAHEFNREANRCFQQAEVLDPRDPAWPYLQGMNLVVHDPEAGIPCLERAAQRCGDGQVGPPLLLAEVLLERGRLDEVQVLLDQVMRTDPYNLRAWLGLGRLALLRQNWKAGLERLDACVSDVHTRKRARILRTEVWQQLGELERARAEQSKAAELPEDRPWPDPFQEEVLKLRRGLRARFLSVNYLMQAGRMNEAIDLLDQTLKMYPQSIEGWMRLGDIRVRTQKLGQAEACYRQAVDLAPDMAEAWYRLGCVQALEHSPEAMPSFRQAIRYKPDYAPAHYSLGQCLKESGDPSGAAAEFRKALLCRPDYAIARTALGDLKPGDGEPKKKD
jgi:tetratricopeptide (TPR) repeat protein